MRLLLTKITENQTIKNRTINTKLNLTKRYGFTHLLMFKNTISCQTLWFGRITENSKRINDGYKIQYEKNTEHVTIESINVTYDTICGEETWFTMSEKEHEILKKIKTKNDLMVVLDNISIVKDLKIKVTP